MRARRDALAPFSSPGGINETVPHDRARRLRDGRRRAAVRRAGAGQDRKAEGQPSPSAASRGFYYLPLTIAERLGYFKDEGLDVEISDFAGGSKALQAVVGGSADVVSGAWENTIDQQPKGLNMQGFVLQGRYPAISVGIAKAKAASYKSPKDLKGMKIGVSAPGSSTNRMVLHLLAKDGLKGDDVSIIGVGTAAGAIAAMTSGQDRRDLQRRSGDDDARIDGRHRR